MLIGGDDDSVLTGGPLNGGALAGLLAEARELATVDGRDERRRRGAFGIVRATGGQSLVRTKG